jgi:hypothetical protein
MRLRPGAIRHIEVRELQYRQWSPTAMSPPARVRPGEPGAPSRRSSAGENARREERRVSRAVDADARDGHAGRHLHD